MWNEVQGNSSGGSGGLEVVGEGHGSGIVSIPCERKPKKALLYQTSTYQSQSQAGIVVFNLENHTIERNEGSYTGYVYNSWNPTFTDGTLELHNGASVTWNMTVVALG